MNKVLVLHVPKLSSFKCSNLHTLGAKEFHFNAI